MSEEDSIVVLQEWETDTGSVMVCPHIRFAGSRTIQRKKQKLMNERLEIQCMICEKVFRFWVEQ